MWVSGPLRGFFPPSGPPLMCASDTPPPGTACSWLAVKILSMTDLHPAFLLLGTPPGRPNGLAASGNLARCKALLAVSCSWHVVVVYIMPWTVSFVSIFVCLQILLLTLDCYLLPCQFLPWKLRAASMEWVRMFSVLIRFGSSLCTVGQSSSALSRILKSSANWWLIPRSRASRSRCGLPLINPRMLYPLRPAKIIKATC